MTKSTKDPWPLWWDDLTHAQNQELINLIPWGGGEHAWSTSFVSPWFWAQVRSFHCDGQGPCGVPILRRRLGAVEQCGPPSYRTLTSIRDLHCPPQRLGERTGHCPFVDLWKGTACGPLRRQKTEPCWEVSCCEARNPGNKVCHQGEAWLSARLTLFLPWHVCVQPVAAVSHYTLS